MFMLPQGVTVYDKEKDTVREPKSCLTSPQSGGTNKARTP